MVGVFSAVSIKNMKQYEIIIIDNVIFVDFKKQPELLIDGEDLTSLREFYIEFFSEDERLKNEP